MFLQAKPARYDAIFAALLIGFALLHPLAHFMVPPGVPQASWCGAPAGEEGRTLSWTGASCQLCEASSSLLVTPLPAVGAVLPPPSDDVAPLQIFRLKPPFTSFKSSRAPPLA